MQENYILLRNVAKLARGGNHFTVNEIPRFKITVLY